MHKKTRVLVVDDNIEYLNILKDYLSHIDSFMLVGAASNGKEAIDIIESCKVDVVVLDIVMPTLDGMAVLEYFQDSSPASRPQFIVISAIENDHITKIISKLGAEYFLIKPFDLDILVSRIRLLQSVHQNKTMVVYGSYKEENESVSADVLISDLLNKIGMPFHLKGYDYVKYAIHMVMDDITSINSIIKTVYSKIADEYDTTHSRVERSIRNAIEITFSKGNLPLLQTLFSNVNDLYKPCNSDFILVLANNILENSKQGIH